MDIKVEQKEDSFYANEEISGVKADLDLEKATIEHEFSSPWDESDLVLVVEDQKLHVHRSILKMTSPVFKAMLSSNFKEKDANEITLPGKKVNEFVDFLREIYALLNTSDSQIALKNIKHIYRLADEYQMTMVKKDCRMFLFSKQKTKENAMDMLVLAQDMEAEEARQQCFDVLKKMTFTELGSIEGFSELDGASMQVLVLPIVKEFQQCMKEVIPELLGSLDGLMYLWRHEESTFKMGGVPNTCPIHGLYSVTRYSSRGSLNVDKMHQRINCEECRAMFKQMARNATSYTSSSETYLSENIVNVLEKMMHLTKEHS